MKALARYLGMRGAVLTCALALAAPFALTACDPPNACAALHNGWVKSIDFDDAFHKTASEVFLRTGWVSDGFGPSCQGIRVRDPFVRDSYCYDNLGVWATQVITCFGAELENVSDAALIMTKHAHVLSCCLGAGDFTIHGQQVVYYSEATLFSSCFWLDATPGTASLHCEHHHDY